MVDGVHGEELNEFVVFPGQGEEIGGCLVMLGGGGDEEVAEGEGLLEYVSVQFWEEFRDMRPGSGFDKLPYRFGGRGI